MSETALPQYSLTQQLTSFEEVLGIARKDLNTLLTCDHPPQEVDLIHAFCAVADLEGLVYDIRCKIAMREISSMTI